MVEWRGWKGNRLTFSCCSHWSIISVSFLLRLPWIRLCVVAWRDWFPFWSDDVVSLKRKDRMIYFWGVAGELPKRQSPAQPRWLWLCWLLWFLLKLWNGASLSLERRLRIPFLQGPSARNLLVDSEGGTRRKLKQLSWTPATTGRIAVLKYRAECLLPSWRSSFIEDKGGVLCSFPSWLLEM